MRTSKSLTGENTETLASSADGFRAKTFPWPATVRESLERAAACSSSWCEWWLKQSLATLFGRMFPDYSAATEAMTSAQSLPPLPKSGISEPGGCWTHSSSEWPSGGDESLVCSLREILDGDVPERFYLSAKAAAGILRRAGKRGRALPTALIAALEATVGRSNSEHSSPIAKTPSPNGATQLLLNGQGEVGLLNRSTPDSLLGMKTSAGNLLEAEGQEPYEAEPATVINSSAASTQTNAENSEPAEGQVHSREAEAASNSRVLSVRRLTPTECEKLQGFLVGWTVPDTEDSEMQ